MAASAAATIPTRTNETCEHCALPSAVLIEMAPGRDGVPWYLCTRCYEDGRKPFRLGRFKVTQIADPHLYDALASAAKRTAGLIDMGEGRADDPKASVGSFDKKPRAPRKKKG